MERDDRAGGRKTAGRDGRPAGSAGGEPPARPGRGVDPAPSQASGAGPLDGIRVLDLSRYIAGPFCAQLLGDMGADVVKVERPGGEDSRTGGPWFRGESVYTMVFNRNKRAITLDTRHPSAVTILERLAARSDVLVENYRPGTLEAMGIGAEALHRLNPRLVITSLSGFGQTGPLAERALFDPIAQAVSGLMSLTGDPEGAPTLAGAYVADHLAGLYGAIGTLLALIARERTGAGQVVDVASLDSLFSCLGTGPSGWAMLGELPARMGSRDRVMAPADLFRAADGWVYIHAGSDPLFPKLCEAIGRPDIAADPDLRTVPGRLAQAERLHLAVSAWTEARTIAQIAADLTLAGVAFGPVAGIPDVVASPQIAAREMLVEMEHPALGTLVLPGSPVKLSRTPASFRLPPPLVGEHNDAVYGGLLGLDPSEIAELRASGAI
jgi:crotonobetainyl-CoA:carnitine CoA-transferase CaiB-like acyl-CoA transferase